VGAFNLVIGVLAAIPPFDAVAQHWDFFFFLAFLIGLYSIHRLAKVKEIGEVEERIVIHELASEMRRPLRNLSTASGLRHMPAFPISLLTHAPAIDQPRGE